ncbi:DNA-3-methyladenine glycosylase family protein [Psychrobacillus psychrodurans]|uniref:DNA-3-methyladenine glycosylase II n=1 Tax=Psychrobacillus psychrodurans TaxID=126157 RepID=A0A9X3L7Y6_9BACI|nr:DNA-3-methyladenine glycosylase [Psychrobacillus psychrodurans]MCZ8532991.1 DNA-3-methyladenine glycosylase [Psychrobacillus psychrodurans]
MAQTLELAFKYSMEDVLSRLALDPLNCVDLSNQTVKIPIDETIITIQSIGTLHEPKFMIIGLETDEQYERVLSIFHFNRSLEPIHQHFLGTNLHSLFLKFEGTPIITDFSLYGNIIKSIIHQQLNLSFAKTLTERFVNTFGRSKEGIWLHPAPEIIANLEVSTLREMQFSTRKAEYMIGISKAIAEGNLNLETLVSQSDDFILSELIKYRGIGPWTAESFLLFGLGRENLFPLADVGLQNSLKQLWNLDRKPMKSEIAPHLDSWSPYNSYAALYLWRNIE